MDGTLVDTENLYAKSLVMAADQRGLKLGPKTAENFIIGKSWDSTFTDMKKQSKDLFNSSLDLQQACTKYFDQMIKSHNIAIDTSVALLKDLAQQKPVCIVSGSSRAHIAHFTNYLDIDSKLSFYLGNEDYPDGKPNPGCFLKAAKKAGVEPHECLVFEDSTAGVTAAKKAGMACIGLKRHNTTQDISLADITLNDLADFSFQQLAERIK